MFKTRTALNTSLAKEVAASEAELAQRMDAWKAKYAIELKTAETEANNAQEARDRKVREERRQAEAQAGLGTRPLLPGNRLTDVGVADYDIIAANRVLEMARNAVPGTPMGEREKAELKATIRALTDFITTHPAFKKQQPGDYDDIQAELRLLNMRVQELSTNVIS